MEVACDLIFPDCVELDDAFEFLHHHMVRRWHGKRQKIRRFEDGARYDAGRWAPNGIVMYREPFSRATGEADCLHLEWRLNGLDAVRGAGIKRPQELLNFNHRAFWEPRLDDRFHESGFSW